MPASRTALSWAAACSPSGVSATLAPARVPLPLAGRTDSASLAWRAAGAGKALSDRFTLYVPDRRSRGMSGLYSKDHGLRPEIEDLDALLDKTQAHNLFGLSAGAVIAIEAARTLPASTRLALYEPPPEFDDITQTSWLPRYEREMAAGRLAAALVTIMKGTADRTAFRVVPRFLLTGALSLAIRTTVPAGLVSPRARRSPCPAPVTPPPTTAASQNSSRRSYAPSSANQARTHNPRP